MSELKYYLAGPMSGYDDHNFPAFVEFENALRKRQLVIVSPRDITLAGEGADRSKPWHWYLKQDLKAMLECDAIILMPGWRKSRGARLESFVADKLNMKVFSVNSEFQVKSTRMGDQSI